uniref:Uncharacterized protein n=1 Tax=Rhizophagus irregularis (strain DAOM 181602 / DAOM 197198 / MUCL 43194) TaxID=747089 RepID=U9ULM9_RHIID
MSLKKAPKFRKIQKSDDLICYYGGTNQLLLLKEAETEFRSSISKLKEADYKPDFHIEGTRHSGRFLDRILKVSVLYRFLKRIKGCWASLDELNLECKE